MFGHTPQRVSAGTGPVSEPVRKCTTALFCPTSGAAGEQTMAAGRQSFSPRRTLDHLALGREFTGRLAAYRADETQAGREPFGLPDDEPGAR